MPGVLVVSKKIAADGWVIPPPPRIRALAKLVREWGAMGSDERVDAEPWKNFVLRVNPYEPASLARRDLRRLASEVWEYSDLEDCVPGLLQHCAKIAKRRLDRRLARAYWNRFKTSVPAFEELAVYCAQRQAQLGAPWNEIAAAIPLWDYNLGPGALGQTLLREEHREAFFSQVNLRSQDMQGGFVEAAFGALLQSRAVRNQARRSVALEQSDGDDILSLGRSLGDGTIKANADLLAYVLLKPWTTIDPEEAYRDQVIVLLLEKLGDPRTSQNEWDTLAGRLSQNYGLDDAQDVLGVLHHWITEKTVRLFFDLIARTTDRPDQWKERRAFWESYLDKKYVERAWFALGNNAGDLAKMAKSSQGLLFGRVAGNGAASSQSVLLMKIGDLIIAEWSDNGRARFWLANSGRAPAFNKPRYEGQSLRLMNGGSGFVAMAHQGKWYRKFADHITEITGISYSGPRSWTLWGW